MDILTALDKTSRPAERVLREWFAARRYAGSGDRRAIGEQVYRILRHRFSLGWRMGSDSPRALVIAALLADGEDPAALFSGGYGPAPLEEAERKRIATAPGAAPLWVRCEFPQWLESELSGRFGAGLEEEMAAFLERAPVDLRVNRLKASRDEVLARLTADGFSCAAIGKSGLRCPPGTANLDKHALYLSGAFEIQDLAAQTAAELAGAEQGMKVLDLAAGAGGKALAFAAAMQNKGEILACDVRASALAELEKRAGRAGVEIIRTRILTDPPPALGGDFDLVFIDAPCSGSGTWRRQPELKSRLTPERLAALHQTQDRLLAAGARAAGGRLVYATCSILPSENQGRVQAFLVKNPQFRRLWPDFEASPRSTGSDGFYAAFLGRKDA